MALRQGPSTKTSQDSRMSCAAAAGPRPRPPASLITALLVGLLAPSVETVELLGVCEEAVRRARTAAARRAVSWDEVEGGARNVGGRCPGGEVWGRGVGEVWGRGVSEAEVCGWRARSGMQRCSGVRGAARQVVAGGREARGLVVSGERAWSCSCSLARSGAGR
eukprot:scaffold74014_cov43-Phaeocystis_antarctica.AAC.1